MALLPKEPCEPFAIGFSRRNWSKYAIEKISEAYQLENLQYFSQEAATLDLEKIQLAASDIESLLTSIAENPQKLIEVTECELYTEEEILQVVSSPDVVLNPYSLTDDGNNTLYLIDYLKANLHILKLALREKKGVVFAQVG